LNSCSMGELSFDNSTRKIAQTGGIGHTPGGRTPGGRTPGLMLSAVIMLQSGLRSSAPKPVRASVASEII